MSADFPQLAKDVQALAECFLKEDFDKAQESWKAVRARMHGWLQMDCHQMQNQASQKVSNFKRFVASNRSATQDIATSCRRLLEFGLKLAGLRRDAKEFDLLAKLLSPLYNEDQTVARSKERKELRGMILLSLLSKEDAVEFHREVERMTEEERKDPDAKAAIDLDSYITAGNFKKVNCCQNVKRTS